MQRVGGQMSDAIWLLLDRIGTVIGLMTGVASVAAAAWAWVERNDLKRWLRRNTFGQVSLPLPEGSRFDALVVPVSKADTPCWLIDTLRPAQIVLIASAQSREAAETIQAHAKLTATTVAALHVLPDADDAAAFRAQATASILALRRSGASRVAVDVTGGKVPMSLGLFMAAEEAGATTLYVSADFDPGLKSLRKGSQRLVAVTTPN